jgi:hypothetical protein
MFAYQAGIVSMAEGVMHLLFPERWGALWLGFVAD